MFEVCHQILDEIEGNLGPERLPIERPRDVDLDLVISNSVQVGNCDDVENALVPFFVAVDQVWSIKL